MFDNGTTKKGKKGSYRQVSLDEFSDDDDDSNSGDHEDLTPPSASHDSRNSSTHGGGGGMGRQQELMQRQDEGLEMLSQSAERLGAMSLQIGDELNFQNRMLDDMEGDLERADEDLDVVTRQTRRFIEQAGGTRNCVVIAALTAVVLVLLILLIYF